MKQRMVLGILGMLMFLLVACGGTGSTVDYEEAVRLVKEQIVADLREGGMPESYFTQDAPVPTYVITDVKGGDLSLTPIPDLEQEWVKNGTVIQAGMIVNSNLIMIVEATNGAAVQNIVAAFEEAKTKQEQVWSTYLPDQYKKVQENILSSKGNLVYYITYETPAEIESILTK